MSSESGDSSCHSEDGKPLHSSPLYRHKKLRPATIDACAIHRDTYTPENVATPVRQEAPLSPGAASVTSIVSRVSSHEQPISCAGQQCSSPPVGAARTHRKCIYCGNLFAKPSELDKHIRSHTNERPFSCRTCRYSFTTKSNLVKHCKTRKHAARSVDDHSGSRGAEDCDRDEWDGMATSCGSDAVVIDTGVGNSVNKCNGDSATDQCRNVSGGRPANGAGRLTHSIDSIMSRSSGRCRDAVPTAADRVETAAAGGASLTGVVRHIDNVIQLNEQQLSDTRRALANFGRHNNTLVRERAALRSGDAPLSLSPSSMLLSSTSAVVDRTVDGDKLAAANHRPSVLMRSHSLSADVGHVLKRRLLSVADGVNGVLDTRCASLPGSDFALSVGSDIPCKKARRSSSDSVNNRVFKCFSGGEMTVVSDKECNSRLSGAVGGLCIANASSDHVPDSMSSSQVLTIKSNLNSGGQMIEVDFGADNCADSSRRLFDNGIASTVSTFGQVGTTRVSTSLSLASNGSYRYPDSFTSSFAPSVHTHGSASKSKPMRLSYRDGLSGRKVKSILESKLIDRLPRLDPSSPTTKSSNSVNDRSLLIGGSTRSILGNTKNRFKKLSINMPPVDKSTKNDNNRADFCTDETVETLSVNLPFAEKRLSFLTQNENRRSSVDIVLLERLKKKLAISTEFPISRGELSLKRAIISESSPKSSNTPNSCETQINGKLGDACEVEVVDNSLFSRKFCSSSSSVRCDSGRHTGPVTLSRPSFLPIHVSNMKGECSMMLAQHTAGSTSSTVDVRNASAFVTTLQSPETPQALRTIRERCVDGRCYTHIRLKSSTRLYFCCMFQTQPNYVEQPPQHRQVSMYSQWRQSRAPTSSVPVTRALCSVRLPRAVETCVCHANNCVSASFEEQESIRKKSAVSGEVCGRGVQLAGNIGCAAKPFCVQAGHCVCLLTSVGRKWPEQKNGQQTPPVSAPVNGTTPADPCRSTPENTEQSTASSTPTRPSSTQYSCIPSVLEMNAPSFSESSEEMDRCHSPSSQKTPIDLCTRPRALSACHRASPVLSVLNCTEELARLYGNLDRFSRVESTAGAAVGATGGPAGPAAAPVGAASQQSVCVPSSSAVSSAARATSPRPAPETEAVGGAELVAVGGAVSEAVGGAVCVAVGGAVSEATTAPISSAAAALATPKASSTVATSCTANTAPPNGTSKHASSMQAVLNDIFQQVRSERYGGGGSSSPSDSGARLASLNPASVGCVSAATSASVSAASPVSSAAAAAAAPKPLTGEVALALHPNVTAGQPGLALTDLSRLSRHLVSGASGGAGGGGGALLAAPPPAPYNRHADRPVCAVCGKRDFVNRDQLAAHARTHQMERRSHRCQVCEVGFRSEQQLARHQRSTEHAQKLAILERRGGAATDRRVHECLFCMRGFHNVGILHKHLRCKAHITGLENAGWLPCGVYAQLEASRQTHDTIRVQSVWHNYCHLQELALTLLSERTCEMADWRVKFGAIQSGQHTPASYPYEIDAKLRGNVDDSRPRPEFPRDFLPLPASEQPAARRATASTASDTTS